METRATTSERSTLEKLVEIIRDGLEWPSDDGPPGADTRIGESGLGMDSLMVIELALSIEEEFGFEIDEDEIFNIGDMTLGGLAEFVDRRAEELSK